MAYRLKFLAASLLLMLFFNQSWSQEVKVIARKGDVQVVNGLDVRLASTNMTLTGSERILLGENSYLSMVDEKGGTAELELPGQYELRELFGGKNKNGSGTAYRYANYLLERMTPEGKKNRLGAMGYFIRADDTEEEPIRLYIPGAGKYYQDHLELSWEDAVGGGPYTVEISNMYHELLKTVETRENAFRLEIDEDLGVQNILLIRVISDNGPDSELYALKRLGSFHREDLTADLQKLSEVYSEKNAVSRFVMAGFFEYHNLLADALTCYLEAIRAAPDVPLYREAYEDFLLRNHLVKL